MTEQVSWAIMVMAQLIQRGRREGWVEGEPTDGELPDPSSIAIAGGEAMRWMVTRLELDEHDERLLWLLASIELSPAAARLAEVFGRDGLSVQIVKQLVPKARLEVLQRRGLIEMCMDVKVPQYRRWIRVNDRVLSVARGDIELDRELAGACEVVVPDEIAARATEIPPAIARGFEGDAPVLIVATGAAGSGRATLLMHAAARFGCATLRVSKLAAVDGELRSRQLRAVARECQLFGIVPLLTEVDGGIDELLGCFEGPILATSTGERAWRASRPVVVHAVEAPSIERRAALWRTQLGNSEVAELVAARYTTTPGTIVAAAKSAVARAGANITVEDVHEGLRAHLDEKLAGIATRVPCTQTWRDLVLPADQMDQIVELVARVRHKKRVLDDWGFADKVGRGVGMAALMSGPPGTGKTMAAGLIARELQLDLYQVDLSRVVSKYIGETEKNLSAVFDAAESGHAVILFDEADSLFAKRSEVKSSNDRYANLEVNYLLQRIEQFRGISILTTNHATAIDEAFRRRLAIHIRFAIPDEEQRELLWRAMIPGRAEVTRDIDFRDLAREFEMTGGYIKNATLRAAYLAANASSAISGALLRRAARAEYEAMGKITYEAA